jgi:hypothetical protein
VPLPNTKVEFWNVKVHEPPVEHEDPQSGEPHGTLRNDDDLDGSNATSHGSPPVLEKHGLHRMLDMPLTSKKQGELLRRSAVTSEDRVLEHSGEAGDDVLRGGDGQA